MSQRNFEGSKYQETRSLGVREIAALIRKDLKKYPTKDGYKFSVRSAVFSGGASIYVTIRSVPEGMAIETIPFQEWKKENPHAAYISAPERYSDEIRVLMSSVTDIVNAYNFDNSDSSSDYYHSNFFQTICLRLDDGGA